MSDSAERQYLEFRTAAEELVRRGWGPRLVRILYRAAREARSVDFLNPKRLSIMSNAELAGPQEHMSALDEGTNPIIGETATRSIRKKTNGGS